MQPAAVSCAQVRKKRNPAIIFIKKYCARYAKNRIMNITDQTERGADYETYIFGRDA